MTKYVALLRGINVGGHQVPMARLQKAFEEMGCENVRTILASGNVVFEATQASLRPLTKKLEATLARTFGFSIPVFLRTRRDMEELIESQPFKGIKITPETRFHVTFLSEKPRSSAIAELLSGRFQIVSVADMAVCTHFDVSPEAGTVDLMSALEGQFGKRITTRSWNTVEKVAKM